MTEIKFIDVEAQADFQNRFKPFIQELSNIKKITENIDIQDKFDYKEQIIYFFWNTILDDFFEIILLYANGYPLGSLKILRGMFERAVHILQFEQNPVDIDLFVDFGWIDERKLIRYTPQVYDNDYVNEIEKGFKEIEKNFKFQCVIDARKKIVNNVKKQE